MRCCVSLLALLFLCTGNPRASAEDAPRVVETEHYRLVTDASAEEAAEWGRVLEATWTGLADWFEKTPKLRRGERLEVRMLATRDAWAEALRADGVTPPTDAGGYYVIRRKTAYLFRQPTTYFTRVLLVHEATHQFHYLACTRNLQPTSAWYREGVAEFNSWHCWDGERLQMRVAPPISLKDYAAVALKRVEEDDFDLEAVVEGRAWPGYAVVWALFRYLATGREGTPLKGFEAFCRKMDTGGSAKALFPRFFRSPARFRDGFVSWLRGSQQPWIWVFNEWDPLGPRSLRGFAGVVSVCRTSEPVDRLSATMVVPDGGPEGGAWRGGLLLGIASSDDYVVALVDCRGELRVDHRRGGQWKRLAREEVDVPRDGSPLALEAERTPKGVVFGVGETRFGPYRVPGETMGLAVDACRLVFRNLAWE